MIWTFTPNPALDITWQAPDQTRGQVHRITEYSQRPGGKGLNVSRVLEQLGVPNHATGFLGGTTGQAIASLMEEMTTQVTTHWVDVPVQTRRSIAMIDGVQRVRFLSSSSFLGRDARAFEGFPERVGCSGCFRIPSWGHKF